MADTELCGTCGATLEIVVTASGSHFPITCLICYGDPESAPVEEAPEAPAEEEPDEDPEPQTAAEAELPRELGTDTTTAQEG